MLTPKDILPIVQLGLESHTHSIVDKSLGCLPTILKILDFSTIKNELFPVIAAVFSKTSSLGIKIRGLEAFVVLCGGSNDSNAALGDDLDGNANSSAHSTASNSTILDKYTVQEKIVPLLKVMKTKEPAVMMAALAVFRQVGKIADPDFLAMDVLPILWSFSLGPLLNLQQFQEFMTLIKSLSSKIEQEQTRKLRDLSSSNAQGIPNSSRANDLMNVGSLDGMAGTNGTDDAGESDFERLVLGRGGTANNPSNDMLGESLRPQPQRAHSSQAQIPVFSWSTPTMSPTTNSTFASSSFANPGSRAITPDQTLSSFAALSPVPAGASYANRPNMNGLSSFTSLQPTTPSTNPWGTVNSTSQATTASSIRQPGSNFSIAPPPQTTSSYSTFSMAPPPSQNQRSNPQTAYGGTLGTSLNASSISTPPVQPPPKKGLDAYESLI